MQNELPPCYGPPLCIQKEEIIYDDYGFHQYQFGYHLKKTIKKMENGNIHVKVWDVMDPPIKYDDPILARMVMFEEKYSPPKIFCEGIIRNKKREGIWIFYEENKIKYEIYEDGKLNMCKAFYNGKLEWKCEYKDGVKEGDYIGFHKNGKIETKGQYKNGNPIGVWFKYNENGILIEKLLNGCHAFENEKIYC